MQPLIAGGLTDRPDGELQLPCRGRSVKQRDEAVQPPRAPKPVVERLAMIAVCARAGTIDLVP